MKIHIPDPAFILAFEIKAESRKSALPARKQEIGGLGLPSGRSAEILLLILVQAEQPPRESPRQQSGNGCRIRVRLQYGNPFSGCARLDQNNQIRARGMRSRRHPRHPQTQDSQRACPLPTVAPWMRHRQSVPLIRSPGTGLVRGRAGHRLRPWSARRPRPSHGCRSRARPLR
jgi:hypothetical protein